MPVSQIKLVEIADGASKEYLEKKASMESYITKEANRLSLNDEEIRRVTEYANLKTYHALKKTASVVEFDVADPEKIVKSTDTKTIKSASVTPTYHTDYMSPPPAPLVKQASTKEPQVFEKTADMFLRTEVPSFNKEFRISTNTLNEKGLEFDTRIDKLASQVKDLVRNGADESDLKTMFMEVDPGGVVWEAVEGKLGFSKEAEYVPGRFVNPAHPLVNEIKSLSKTAEFLFEKSIIQGALAEAFQKEAGVVIKKLKTPAMVLGGLVGAAGIYAMGKKSQETDQNLKEFEQYQHLRANGAIK